VGKSYVMFNILSHTKPPRHEAFFQVVVDQPREFHRRLRDHDRFPFVLISLGVFV